MLTRRREHAEALNAARAAGLGPQRPPRASWSPRDDPDELPPFDLAIVATKATGLEPAAAALEGHFPEATVMTVLNGLGAEEVVRAHGDWQLVSAVTFMSGTKHSDTHVEYILDTETWLGPYEDTPYARVEEIAGLIERAGPEGRGASRPAAGAVVEADLQRDRQLGRRAHRAPARPALRGARRADRPRPPRLRPDRRGQGGRGRGRSRAPRRPVGDERARHAAGERALPVDARGRRRAPPDRDRPDHRRARARGRAPGVPVPLHTAMYRLVKAKEESWQEPMTRTTATATGGR